MRIGNTLLFRLPQFSESFVAIQSAVPFNSKVNDAQDRVQLSADMTTIAVGLFSTVRRKRYHQDEMILRASFPATSPISSITRPKPPACSRRSVALKPCSRLAPQRIQSSLSKSIPANEAAVGEKVSLISTTAQISSCAVA